MNNIITRVKYAFAIPIMVLAALFFAATAHAATTTACADPSLTTKTPGFYGQYFNLDENDPGMERYQGTPIPNPTVGPDNPWYDQQYFSFGRVDKTLTFGRGFFPLKEGKAGDPYFFAVHWSALMTVPTSGTYTFSMTADDDGWLLIDNQTVIDLNGIHPAKSGSATIPLTAGNHVLDIYFAERGAGNSVFTFTPDPKISYYALAPGCPIAGGTPPVITTPGRVLGDSVSRTPYTPAIALYKTANSPAIYAIYANGLRHYISGPTAFHRYGYSINRVKTVSQATLNRYPEARLVRSTDSPLVYFLSPRSNNQWLKLPIPSATAFVSYEANHWGNVIVVDQLDIQAYPHAKLVRARGTSEVFLLQNGKRRLFLSPHLITELGYSTHEILDVTPAHLESFPLGDPIG